MFDIFTFIAYIALLLTTLALLRLAPSRSPAHMDFRARQRLGLAEFSVLAIISSFVGFRYEVGVDWAGYREEFLAMPAYSYADFREHLFEPGYFFLSKAISSLGFTSEWLFLTVAAISWYFILKSVPRLILPGFVLFLFLDELFFWSMNGVRQFAAIAIWLYALRFVSSRSFPKYLSLVLLASLFHRSALILIPLYFLPYQLLLRPKIWMLIFAASLAFGSAYDLVRHAEGLLLSISNLVGVVDYYSERYLFGDQFAVDESVSPGLGFWFKILINLSLIASSGVLVNRHPDTAVYFVLFCLGAVLFNLTYNMHLFGRLVNYFLALRPILLAFAVGYFWRFRNARPIVGAVVSLYVLLFLVAIYQSSNMCAPFRFTFAR